MYKHFLKRFFDIIISVVFLPFFLLFFIIFAPIIKLTDGGPVFYNAPRLGKNGKVFKMYKFRSMCVGAEQQEGGVFCTKGDRRVTKFGNFIRATSIDELPQLINILLGDMSIVGPRPERLEHIKKYSKESKKLKKNNISS